ncbi:EamA family transporter [Paenibacillus sp. CMAA1739]|uniref:DMT family transporter n=1 Tax=Paenibacillus ottowii TaxID=2315729 RepID=UPI00273116E6|nr:MULTISPECIES: EamA family transporter [Paenibacillus]MDP1509887.1 EamA family transporter [Paenibacillus ottowii]MEC4567271.1 EamA family transporter [Paenibacillus sp. CMAA1739]
MNKVIAHHSESNRIYYSSTILALLIWSTSFIATKAAYTTFPPLTLGLSRFIIASIVLGIVLLIKKEHVKVKPKDLATISFSGVLGITLYFSMENIGVSLTTASNAALIVASYPAITSLLEFILYKVKLSKYKICGIALAMIGVYFLTSVGESPDGKNQLIGNLILIGTGFAWAFYTFMTRKVVDKYPPVTLSFYQTVAGSIFFIPLALLEKDSWQAPTTGSFMLLMYLGVFCSVIAFLLYNYGLIKLSPSSSVSLMNLVPIFGVIFSVVLLHETVSWRQMIGGLVVIIGVLMSAHQKNT